VQYTVLGSDARVRRVVDIEVTGSPMMHDFALTERHVVLFDLPCTFDLDAVAALAPRRIGGLVAKGAGLFVGKRPTPEPVAKVMMGRLLADSTPAFPYRWDPKYPARVGVMPRDGGAGDVRWFDVEPCYVFHPLNAYDDGDRIILDVVRHPKMFDAHRLGPDEGPPTLDRWTVDLTAGKVLEERLDDRGQEFPRVDERVVGRRHRYGYTVAFDGVTGDSLIRHDLAGGAPIIRSFGRGHNVGEFVFVPDEADSAEERGTLMGFVHDAATARSDLMLLDAETLETKAAVHLPTRVPAGFHGNWAPA
jgi:carotenoid cleavage dioxygenase